MEVGICMYSTCISCMRALRCTCIVSILRVHQRMHIVLVVSYMACVIISTCTCTLHASNHNVWN